MKRSKVKLDVEALREITNFAHWIPITQGLQKEFFAENYPGWEWNDFVPRLLKKKILVYQSEDPSFIKLRQGLYISGEIEFVEFAPGKNGIEVSCRLYSAI